MLCTTAAYGNITDNNTGTSDKMSHHDCIRQCKSVSQDGDRHQRHQNSKDAAYGDDGGRANSTKNGCGALMSGIAQAPRLSAVAAGVMADLHRPPQTTTAMLCTAMRLCTKKSQHDNNALCDNKVASSMYSNETAYNNNTSAMTMPLVTTR